MHHKSGQLVQRSNVVHVISVQPQEVYCFTVSADKKINITNERRTKLTQKHLEHVGYLFALQDSNTTCGNMFEYRQVAQKTVATVQTFLQSFQKMAICTWHMNLFLALLGLPSLSNFFICRPRMSIFLPKRPDQGNTSTNPLPICWWCLCRRSMAASQSKPSRIRFPRISHLLLYTTTNITSCRWLIIPFCCLITPFFWYIIENLRHIAENPRYSMTQELVSRLYSTGI